MEETFKRIPPEDVFITVFKRKPTEEELWMGFPPDFDGNRPSGNNLIDLFAYLIRKYGRMDTSEYARIMQLKTSELRGAILAIGGMSAMEWRVEKKKRAQTGREPIIATSNQQAIHAQTHAKCAISSAKFFVIKNV